MILPRSDRFDRDDLRTAVRCAGAGLLIAAALPPWGWWPLVFIGLVGFDRLIAAQPVATRFRRGLLIAGAWLAPSILWMWDLTPPGYLIAVMLASTFIGLAAAACPPGRARWVVLPGAFVLAEWGRWSWPLGGVPLSTLPMSQADAPLAPSVRVLGPLLLVALILVIAVGLSAAVDRAWSVVAVAVAVVAGVAVLAAVAPDGQAFDTIDVALVQGGGPQRTRAADTNEREVFERHLEASALVDPPVDLVLWPEDVVAVDEPLVDQREGAELAALARELDATLIVGITERLVDDPTKFANAAVVFDSDGEIGDRFDKVHLVPFGEYVPFRSLVEPFAPDALPTREAVAGRGNGLLDTDAGRFGTLISWEVFFSPRARTAIGADGHALLNPTNGSSYWLTQLQTQQIASSRLRALETGRWVLQAAPTGFTAMITPSGEMVERTGVSERRVIHGTIELRRGNTWAVTLGDAPMLILALAAVAGGWAVEPRLRSRQAKQRHRPAPSSRRGPC